MMEVWGKGFDSEPIFKFLKLYLHVLEDFVEQPRPDGFAGMNRNHRPPSVRVL